MGIENETMDTLVSLAAEMGAEMLFQEAKNGNMEESLTREGRIGYLPLAALMDDSTDTHEAPIFMGDLYRTTGVYAVDVLAIAVWED